MKSSTRIYIYFEGNKDLPPTFIGVLECTDNTERFYQYILEDAFKILAPSAQHHQLRSEKIGSILSSLYDRHPTDTPIYAWSTHEQAMIKTLVTGSHLESVW